MSDIEHQAASAKWKSTIHRIIFGADTVAGKAFDIALIILILLSILGLMLESVTEIHREYELALRILDWTITILFSIEYALRIITTGKPMKYVFSFYGIVDLLAILPTHFLVREWNNGYVRDTLTHPAKGLRASAHHFSAAL